jgi:LuxR family maltose regulon positive regulatory protein
MMAATGLHRGLGTVLYQRNDLVGAAQHIQLAAKLDEFGAITELLFSLTLLAYLKQAMGDYETASKLLGKASKIRDDFQAQQYNISSEPGLDQLHILLSRIQTNKPHLISDVAQRVKTLGKRPDDDVDFSTPANYVHESEYSNLARMLIALNQAAETLPLLERLLKAAQLMGRQGDEIRYLVLSAMAHHYIGNTPTALDFLSKALNQARPQGYVRIFVDEGLPLEELLGEAISKDIAPDYARELLAAFPKDIFEANQFATQLSANQQLLVEPLSEREIDVLRLMAKGYKYKEIAEELVVSINTVRHHTRNVYSKLNVNNRLQAISRAEELHLL